MTSITIGCAPARAGRHPHPHLRQTVHDRWPYREKRAVGPQCGVFGRRKNARRTSLPVPRPGGRSLTRTGTERSPPHAGSLPKFAGISKTPPVRRPTLICFCASRRPSFTRQNAMCGVLHHVMGMRCPSQSWTLSQAAVARPPRHVPATRHPLNRFAIADKAEARAPGENADRRRQCCSPLCPVIAIRSLSVPSLTVHRSSQRARPTERFLYAAFPACVEHVDAIRARLKSSVPSGLSLFP